VNRKETRKAAEVMLAYADGADIQLRPRGMNINPEWGTKVFGGEATWNWGVYEYRIKPRVKPKPREFWVNPEGTVCVDFNPGPQYIHVREIMEEES
jgi:hypothetical protein